MESRMNALLDSLIEGTLTPEQRADLVRSLQAMEQDSGRPISERMAAIVLRASLEARAVHVRN